MKSSLFFLPFFFLSCSGQQPSKTTILNDPSVAMVIGQGLIKANSTAIYFSFTTTNTAPQTSAGVYDGDKLVRTLWSNVTFAAGKHESFWDGKNDLQQFVANGNYQIKVLKSGIEWDWRGTFFNSSDSTTGPTKWHGTSLVGIQFIGNKAYALPYYLEGNYQLFTFNPANPNQKQTHGGLIQQSSFYTCTDGHLIYVAASTDYHTYFAYAFDKDGNEVKFANGEKYESHNSVIGKMPFFIHGITVQKNGRYLFTSSMAANTISVFDKNSGSLIRKNTIKGCGLLACDNTNKLWVIENDIPTQYLVNSDGSFTATGIVLKGVSTIQQLAVSPDNTTISLIDGGLDVQQIKSYSNITGAPIWTLGQLGGYRKTAIVANDRFCFTALSKTDGQFSFINYALDGSFWVGDKGNFRYLHFDKNQHFINQFAFLPSVYNTYVDVNSPTHVYAEYVRATVDYHAQNPQKAWIIDRNYTGRIPHSVEDFENFHTVITLKNGKTYASFRENNDRGKDPRHIQIVELTDSGIRNTGVKYDWQALMSKDGDIWKMNAGGPTTYMLMPLNGFDNSNNPIYGLNSVYASIPIFKDSMPISGDYTSRLNNGDLVTFNASNSDGFHLGILKKNATNFRALFLPSTGKAAHAEYPRDGYFGNGNSTNYPGGQQNTIDSFIIWNHHGEFWNNSGQTSMWQMLDKNGLNIGVWGTLQDVDHPLGECAAWNSGNAVHSQIVKIGTDYFVCWDDESRHGGVHVAKIKNINTLSYDVVNVIKKTDPVLSYSYIDLMQDLPFQRNTIGANNLWTLSDKVDDNWNVKTGFSTYKPTQSGDIRVFFSSPSGTKTLSCNLGNNNLAAWKLTGSISFLDGIANGQFNPVALCYVNVLDANKKIIAQIAVNNTTPTHDYGAAHELQLNNRTIDEDPSEPWKKYKKPVYFELISNGTNFTFNCLGKTITAPILDKNGNIKTPKSLEVQFLGGPYARTIDLQELKFWKQ